MSRKHRITIAITILFSTILMLTCSINNLLPMEFDPDNSSQDATGIIDNGVLQGGGTGWNINPEQIYQFKVSIDSGFLYNFDLYSQIDFVASLSFFKDGFPDTLVFSRFNNGNIHYYASKTSTAFLRIYSRSSLYNQYFTISFSKKRIDSIPPSSYIDSSFLIIKDSPVKSIFTDSFSVDSLRLDQVHRKIRYRIPVDSFEMNELSFYNRTAYDRNILIKWACFSQNSDSCITMNSNDDNLHFRYWSAAIDTLDLIVGLTYHQKTDDLIKIFGIIQEQLPHIVVSAIKKKFPPVKKDPFDDSTSSMIFLKKDTTYTLALYKKNSDSFFFSMNPESTYTFTMTTLDSLSLSANLSPITNSLSSISYIKGTHHVDFKPLTNTTVFGVTIISPIEYPTNYSISLCNYAGTWKYDPYEPDDQSNNASLLHQDSIYRHTIFPQNDVDAFKIYCMGKDTFRIYVDFNDSLLLKKHSGFKLTPVNDFQQGELKINLVSSKDSASFNITTWTRQVADTALFFANDNQLLDYSISLRRR